MSDDEYAYADEVEEETKEPVRRPKRKLNDREIEDRMSVVARMIRELQFDLFDNDQFEFLKTLGLTLVSEAVNDIGYGGGIPETHYDFPDWFKTITPEQLLGFPNLDKIDPDYFIKEEFDVEEIATESEDDEK